MVLQDFVDVEHPVRLEWRLRFAKCEAFFYPNPTFHSQPLVMKVNDEESCSFIFAVVFKAL